MNIQDFGAIGEVVGGIAVVATLIYLSIQLKQASTAIRISTAETGTTHNASVYREIVANQELADLMIRGGSDFESLSDGEYLRYALAVNMQMRFFEHQYHLNSQDALPSGFWDGMVNAIAETLSSPGSQIVWQKQKHVYSSSFADFVSSLEASDSQLSERR